MLNYGKYFFNQNTNTVLPFKKKKTKNHTCFLKLRIFSKILIY